jgi:hypothetical protein
MDEVNCPYGVSISTPSGSGIPFSSMACDEFAAYGSGVGIGPSRLFVWRDGFWTVPFSSLRIVATGSSDNSVMLSKLLSK